ncbi:MAG: amidohydrolase family protein [Actinomycetota bacterium]|nr:amidohydrolase family protein [Actinomycetota bacterium]
MIEAGMISADGHVCEPANCYTDYIDPKFRDRAPHIVEADNGYDVFVVPGMRKPIALGFIDGAGFEPRERKARAGSLKFQDVRAGAYDAKERLAYMDQDGLAAELIYASVGMGICMHRDAEYKDACMWAYNRWLAEMCAGAPERVFGLAQTAVLSVDSAIADFQRAKAMGMVGMMMPGDPIHEDYDHPDYDALWECAADLDLPICFHILTSRAGSIDTKPRGHALNSFLGIIRSIQDVVGMMVLGGVFERHPGLKLVVAESDAGWLPHYMYRLDHAVRVNYGDNMKGLSKLPSEYIRSNVWATFQDDATAYHTLDFVDYRHLLWASDFPHTDSTWPLSRSLVEQQAAHLDEAQKQAIFRDNTATLFNLPAAKASWRMELASV